MTYLGARSLLSPDAGLALGRGWAWQPKVDGCYVTLHLDSAGRICEVLSRNELPVAEGDDLHGIVAGPPFSVLVGELEAHTEAGIRAARTRGHRQCHLFDLLRFGAAPVASLPYLERWGALHRAQSLIEAEGIAPRPRPRAVRWGRRRAPAPFDLRRLPIVPLLRSPTDARALWADVEAGLLEGLVAVRLDAPAGVRGAKRKVKLTDNMEASVLATDGRVMTLQAPGGQVFHLASRFAAQVTPGAVVEVAHHGWYETGTAPRFGRVRGVAEGAEVVRIRWDMSPRAATVHLVSRSPGGVPSEPSRRRGLGTPPETSPTTPGPSAADRAAAAWSS